MYCNGNRRCGCQEGNVDRTVYNCNADRRVVKHQHIIRHRHDIVHEYDVVHEHDYYYRDIVNNREVVRHHDRERYNPNYCGENCDS